jgi:hypothetical protein
LGCGLGGLEFGLGSCDVGLGLRHIATGGFGISLPLDGGLERGLCVGNT